jgi:hypothetical protein
MNILIGKISRPVYFNPANRSIHAGDTEAPVLYTLLAKRFPQHNFYLIGRSDIERYRKPKAASLAEFMGETTSATEEPSVPSNIINLLKDYSAKGAGHYARAAGKETGEYPHEYLEKLIAREGLKFDVGIIFQGPSPCVGIPDRGIQLLNDKGDAKTQDMFGFYYAPIVHTLNITGTPYFTMCSDPRYVPVRQRDVFNDEKFILSQINTQKKSMRIAGYYEKSRSENLRKVTQNFIYGGIETIFLLDEEKKDFREMKKDICFNIAVNSGGPQSDRAEILEEWLLKDCPIRDLKIYGKWEQSFVDKYPGRIEEKKIKDIEDLFWRTRYTFIPPFFKRMPGFVTTKFWKMIYYGIIPFFHPLYDGDQIYDVPSILRVSCPEQMWERIKWLDANPEEYSRTLNEIYSLLKDELFNGDYIINTLNDSVQKATNNQHSLISS